MLTTIISEERTLMTTNLGNNLWNFTMQIQSNISKFQEKHAKKKVERYCMTLIRLDKQLILLICWSSDR